MTYKDRENEIIQSQIGQLDIAYSKLPFKLSWIHYQILMRIEDKDDKADELTHQDLGQMQMYVNYYDRYEKTEGENPTIGILLCKKSDEERDKNSEA